MHPPRIEDARGDELQGERTDSSRDERLGKSRDEREEESDMRIEARQLPEPCARRHDRLLQKPGAGLAKRQRGIGHRLRVPLGDGFAHLVVELSVVLVVLMGWWFAAAEFVGAPIMIAILVLLPEFVTEKQHRGSTRLIVLRYKCSAQHGSQAE